MHIKRKIFIALMIFAMIFTSFSCKTDIPVTTPGQQQEQEPEGIKADEIASATFSDNQTIKIVGPITSSTIYTLKNKISSLTGITLDLSKTTGLDSIGDYAFGGYTGLTSVIIPDSVTSIGKSAFYDCTGLASVTIPDSVTSIGEDAFNGCTGLTSVTIPDSVTSIGDDAFYVCSELTSMTIPDSVTSIGNSVFSGCTGLTSVTIGNGVTSIGRLAFNYCTGLTSVTIGNGVTSIGNSVFSDCTGLTSVAFKDTTGWWYASSEDATSGTDINVSDPATNAANLTVYSWRSSYLFKGGNDQPLGYEITYVLNGGDYTYNPASYTAENLPITLRNPNREGYTFDGWYETEDFSGDAVTQIATGSTGAKIFYAKWTKNEGGNTGDDGNNTGDGGNTSTGGNDTPTPPPAPTEYNITYYLNGGANNTSNANKYTAGQSLSLYSPTRTGYTFAGWYTSYSFSGDAITEISASTTGSISLYAKWTPTEYTITYELNGGTNSTSNPATYTVESATISLTVPTRKDYAFIGWYETEDFSGEAVTAIAKGTTGDKTFYAKWIEGIGKYEIESATFSSNSTIKIVGPITSSTISTLKNKINSLTGITLDLSETTGLTYIGGSAFFYCKGLTSVTIPDSVTSIGTNAFFNCMGLTSVTIPDSVTSIGSNAFYGCSKLTSVTIGNSVTSIGNNAFDGCSKLTRVTIGNSVTSIGNSAFSGCSKLTSVTIGNSVTSIGNKAFHSCTELTNVTIPNSVTSIGENAFLLSGIESVTIPSSVTLIERWAFQLCDKLSSVAFEDNSGWWYADSKDATSGTSIDATDLEKPADNATKLKSNGIWCNNYLFKGERN